MMRPDELRLKVSALKTFENMVATYKDFADITSVDLYYNGHAKTMHGSAENGDEVSRVVRGALLDRWAEKLRLEAANLRSHGVDPTPLMPKDLP